MFKLFIFIFIFFISLKLTAHEEPAKTLKEKSEKEKKRTEIIKNNVKSMTVWKLKISNDAQNSKKEKYYTTFYDVKGNISEIVVYENDSITGKTVYSYDEKNNMVSDIDYNSAGEINDAIKYFYDSEERVTEQLNYTGNGEIDSKFIYSMDKNKNEIVFIKYKPLEKIEYKIIYRYDGIPDSSNNIEISKQNPDGSLIQRVENNFDSTWKRTIKKIFDSGNKLLYYFEYKYLVNTEDFSSILKYSSSGALTSKTEYFLNQYGMEETIKTSDSYGNVTSQFSITYEMN